MDETVREIEGVAQGTHPPNIAAHTLLLLLPPAPPVPFSFLCLLLALSPSSSASLRLLPPSCNSFCVAFLLLDTTKQANTR